MPALSPGSVVVITGASSGIGRATAHAFAKRGARLVLVARRVEALESTAAECRELGATGTLVESADVGEASAMAAVRQAAVAGFGRIDVWINGAAVLLFGRFEEIPPGDFERVIATNLLGVVNGSREALLQFREQGEQGTLINIASVLGTMGEPFTSPYITSKFAVRGLTASLRQEARDAEGIQISAILPGPIDTPAYQRAANFTGRAARAIAPVYAPEKVAAAIVHAVEHPRAEIVVGGFGHLLALSARMTPRLLERVVARIGPAVQFRKRPAAPSTGNLERPDAAHAVGGGWRAYWASRLQFWRRTPRN